MDPVRKDFFDQLTRLLSDLLSALARATQDPWLGFLSILVSVLGVGAIYWLYRGKIDAFLQDLADRATEKRREEVIDETKKDNEEENKTDNENRNKLDDLN